MIAEKPKPQLSKFLWRKMIDRMETRVAKWFADRLIEKHAGYAPRRPWLIHVLKSAYQEDTKRQRAGVITPAGAGFWTLYERLQRCPLSNRYAGTQRLIRERQISRLAADRYVWIVTSWWGGKLYLTRRGYADSVPEARRCCQKASAEMKQRSKTDGK